MCELKSAIKIEIGNESLRRVENIHPGDHVCCIYNTDEEHHKLLAPFMSSWTITKEGEPGKGTKFTITIPNCAKEKIGNLNQSAN